MFDLFRKRRRTVIIPAIPRLHVNVRRAGGMETLEERRFLSGSHHGGGGGPGGGHGGGHGGGGVSEITFSLLPSAVQTGLTSLASTDGYDAPTSTTEVYLGNRDGVETYSIRESSTGTSATLTVDVTGAAITASTKATTTFGAISNSAVTNEFNAIATALSLTAPASADSVSVSTTSAGVVSYRLGLTSTTSSGKTRTSYYTVDANGLPVGNERVPLSVLPTAIQNGLTSNAPSGATALTSTSLVSVQTVDGVSLYTANYSGTGLRASVTVNASGVLASASKHESVTFADVPAVAAAELQAIATAKGVTTTIASTAAVTKITEANGTVLYSIKVDATSTTDSTKTRSIVLTVDAAGNPTVASGGGGFGGGAC